jgi:hypothetical protein
MIKNIVHIFFLIAIISISCKKTYEKPDPTVVINEVMPVNSATAADQNGEYDDWIELYNLTSKAVDLSGYYLSDTKKDLTKWKFPEKTNITANGYLIIWADNDTLETGLHANFKLSSAGEEAILTNPQNVVIDKVVFPAQTLDITYSRIPNGTGDFKWSSPTFNRSNGSK